MLYERDYNILTEEEKKLWDKAEKILSKSASRVITTKKLAKYYEVIPKAVLHHRELFPNNHISTRDLDNKEIIRNSQIELLSLLDNRANERDVLNHIRDTKRYFIVGSIFHYERPHFKFGHHNAFLFKEFSLGTKHVVDYLLVGKNSGGYEFIYIEFESPEGSVTIGDGEFGNAIRKGINQVEDWQRWLNAEYPTLETEFEKYLGVYDRNMPKEFHKLDRSRLHYVVVAGRRNDYTEKTYALRRELFKDKGITLLHYDNILDSLNWLLLSGNY